MKHYCRPTLLISLAALCSTVIAAQQTTQNLSSTSSKADPSWSQYGFLASHSSFNNLEHTLNRANVSGLTLQWAGEVGTSAASAPIVGQGIVYVAADGMIFAFQASDGTPLWSHLSCGGLNTVEAALGPQALLVGDGGGDLAAYDPVTGNQMWCLDEGGSITSAPAVDASTVYITNGASVVAVDQLTGTPRWSFTPSDLSPVTNTPAVLNQTVYVTGGNSVFALAGATGQQLWRTDVEVPFVAISAPSVAGETVYVGGNHLYALGAADGSLLWTQSIVGVGVSTPAIAHNKLFVNSLDPFFGLWAFRADNGAFLWHNATPEESSSTLTVANGVVFDIAAAGGLAGVGGLMMFNSDTGALLGSIVDPDGHPFNNFPGSQPAVVGGTVYIPTSDGSGSNRVDAFRLP
jgi:eukaryotic-like serine/threonine-protein kinase